MILFSAPILVRSSPASSQPILNGHVLVYEPAAQARRAGARLTLGTIRGRRTLLTDHSCDLGESGRYSYAPSFVGPAIPIAYLLGPVDEERPALWDVGRSKPILLGDRTRCTAISVSPDGRAAIAVFRSQPGQSSGVEVFRLPTRTRLAKLGGDGATFWIDGGRKALLVEYRTDGRSAEPVGTRGAVGSFQHLRAFFLIDARSGANHPISEADARWRAPVVVRALDRHLALTGVPYAPGTAGLYVSPDALATLVSVNAAMRPSGGLSELLLPNGVVRRVFSFERHRSSWLAGARPSRE